MVVNNNLRRCAFMPILESAKPTRIAPAFIALRREPGGFFVLATDSVTRSFADSDDAVAAIRAVIDERLRAMPIGNC
jgi:hypothetical protein